MSLGHCARPPRRFGALAVVGLVLFGGPALDAGGPPVVGTLGLDETFPSGADDAGRLEVYTPNPVVVGSSISHWSSLAQPDLLMKPFASFFFGDDVDLTDEALGDLGWPLGGGAVFNIVHDDGPGEGFNDPSPPILPAPGNAGATLGAQRLIVLERAAEIWEAILQSPVPIEIAANFDPFDPCSPGGGTFSAFGGPLSMHANFAGAPEPDTWYPQAMANSLSGSDQSGASDLFNIYNSGIDEECLGAGTGFYYGLDHAVPAGKIDLLSLALHEIGHGLGFVSLVDLTTGSFAGPPFFPDIYTSRLLDTSVGLHWSEMASDAERLASSVNTAAVVFDSPTVTLSAPDVLAPRSALVVLSPPPVAGSYEGNFANFGPPLTTAGVTAELACGFDGGGVSITDACEPLADPADLAGRLVLVDRGTCAFAQKAGNVQAAGGVGMLVVNNVPGVPPQMAGPGPDVTIPSLILPQSDGEAIRAAVCGGGSVVDIPTLGPIGLWALALLLLYLGMRHSSQGR